MLNWTSCAIANICWSVLKASLQAVTWLYRCGVIYLLWVALHYIKSHIAKQPMVVLLFPLLSVSSSMLPTGDACVAREPVLRH